MTVVGSGADCRHKASLSCYEDGDTEAQRGAETCSPVSQDLAPTADGRLWGGSEEKIKDLEKG